MDVIRSEVSPNVEKRTVVNGGTILVLVGRDYNIKLNNWFQKLDAFFNPVPISYNKHITYKHQELFWKEKEHLHHYQKSFVEFGKELDQFPLSSGIRLLLGIVLLVIAEFISEEWVHVVLKPFQIENNSLYTSVGTAMLYLIWVPSIVLLVKWRDLMNLIKPKRLIADEVTIAMWIFIGGIFISILLGIFVDVPNTQREFWDEAGINRWGLIVIYPWVCLVEQISWFLVWVLFHKGLRRVMSVKSAVWVGGVLTTFVFGLWHVDAWGWGQSLISIMIPSYIWAIAFPWSRSLLTIGIAHFFNNTFVDLVAMSLK